MNLIFLQIANKFLKRASVKLKITRLQMTGLVVVVMAFFLRYQVTNFLSSKCFRGWFIFNMSVRDSLHETKFANRVIACCSKGAELL